MGSLGCVVAVVGVGVASGVDALGFGLGVRGRDFGSSGERRVYFVVIRVCEGC